MKALFSVIRCVPYPTRGEFVNVGAIVGSEESGEWQVRQVSNTAHARKLDDRNALPAALDVLNQIGRALDEYESALEASQAPALEPSEQWLRALSDQYRNIVQMSDPTPIRTESISDALDRVFELFVCDPERTSRDRLTKHAVLSALGTAYRRSGVDSSHISKGVNIAAAKFHDRFDFAIRNGSVSQLAQTWSFQVQDQDGIARAVRAWGWAVRALRDDGGRLELDGLTEDVSRDVQIAVAYAPPAQGQTNTLAMDEAMAVFDEVAVDAAPLDEVDRIAKQAATLLDSSSEPN